MQTCVSGNSEQCTRLMTWVIFLKSTMVTLVALRSVTHCSKNKVTLPELFWIWIKFIYLDLRALQ